MNNELLNFNKQQNQLREYVESRDLKPVPKSNVTNYLGYNATQGKGIIFTTTGYNMSPVTLITSQLPIQVSNRMITDGASALF